MVSSTRMQDGGLEVSTCLMEGCRQSTEDADEAGREGYIRSMVFVAIRESLQ